MANWFNILFFIGSTIQDKLDTRFDRVEMFVTNKGMEADFYLGISTLKESGVHSIEEYLRLVASSWELRSVNDELVLHVSIVKKK